MKKIIGVIYKDEMEQGFTHSYFAAILEGFRQVCFSHGYAVAFLNYTRGEEESETYLEQIKKIDCAGVLIAREEDMSEVQDVLDSGFVVATIDKDYDKAINVSSDNVKGMDDIAEYIIRMGHRRIAMITGGSNLVSSVRLQEFLKVCEKHEIDIPKEYIQQGEFRDSGKAAYLTEKLLKLQEPPTCIIFSDDYSAIGGINVIHARGLEIPADISIVGHEGNDILFKLEPAITTVSQGTFQMGRIAAERMIEAIENPQKQFFENIMVDASVRVGRTVRKIYEQL